MALVRWEPLRELDTLQQEINRLFDTSFMTPRRGNGLLANIPAAEIEETDDAYHLRLEVPGMDAKDINVEVTAESVSIGGERKSETKTETEGMVRSEFRYGKFQRVVPLPGRINNKEVQADYTDGILSLTLPKVEEEKSKVVKVNLG